MKGASIKINNVSVTLQGNHLLKNISLTLAPGEHLAVIGASGSGKTTLAKVVAGQMFTSGSVQIEYDEQSALHKEVWLTEQRNQFKTLSNTTDFYYQQRYNSFDNSDAQTVTDALQSVTNEQNNDEIDLMLMRFGLYSRKNAPLIQLSSGENRKFQLIKAILLQPQILILDTPFTGLDVVARKRLHLTISSLAEKGTKMIIITDAQQVPECITHVALLENGRLQSLVSKAAFKPAETDTHAPLDFHNVSSLPVAENEKYYESIVLMKNVNVTYDEKVILKHINWQIYTGDKWLLRGANGAGKSTLISLLNGDNPQAYKNDIYLFGKRRGSGESIWDIKKKIGFVSPELHAFYDKQTSCYNAVASGFFDTIGLFRKLSVEQHAKVKKWIDVLHLSNVQNKPLINVSFGVQRLVLLARAMVKCPPLLILDEPCQGLDEDQKKTFINLVDDICEQLHKTLIYISHYSNEIPACIDHVIELNNGAQKTYLRTQEELVY